MICRFDNNEAFIKVENDEGQFYVCPDCHVRYAGNEVKETAPERFENVLTQDIKTDTLLNKVTKFFIRG